MLIPCGIPYTFMTVGSIENNLIPDAVLEKIEIIDSIKILANIIECIFPFSINFFPLANFFVIGF